MLDLHSTRFLPPSSTSQSSYNANLPSYNFTFDWPSRLGDSVRDLQTLRLNETTPVRRLSPASAGSHLPSHHRRPTSRSSNPGGQQAAASSRRTPEMNSADGLYSMSSGHYSHGISHVSHPVPELRSYSAYNPLSAPAPHPMTYQPHLTSISRPASRPESPIFQQDEPPSRRGSTQNGGIVSYLQIPSTISSSRGSLAEFAAQITCLFWFESSTTLSSIEDSEYSPAPSCRLAPEAVPPTGFLKWVTTILSTTQVTQNVILLALLFVYRLKKQNPTVKGKPGSEYRLLTVALMLGNKFLDDNTYTNKTWAEVSGISVQEIHVMEVEFLSHMKYNLYTSKEEWQEWHRLLSKFWTYFDRASRKLHEPLPRIHALRPPTLQIPLTLPSPPASANQSPPYGSSAISPTSVPYNSVHAIPQQLSSAVTVSPTYSPLDADVRYGMSYSRKRSIDAESYTAEPPAKRPSYSYPSQAAPRLPYPVASQPQPASAYPSMTALPMPNLPLPVNQTNQNHTVSTASLLPATTLTPVSAGRSTPSQTLPPIQWAGGMAMQPALGHGSASLAHSATPSRRPHNSYLSQPSEGPSYPSSAAHTTTQKNLSPSHFLIQRTSPYRPVRHMSQLLVPPPTGRVPPPPNQVPHEQMHWQPLGKSQTDRRTGRVPYLHRDAWPQTNQVDQWPSMHPMEMPPHH